MSRTKGSIDKWSRLSWKAVDTTPYKMFEGFEDGSFCGLEEINGDQIKLLVEKKNAASATTDKKSKKVRITEETNEDEAVEGSEEKKKKPSKANKKKRAIEEMDVVPVESTDQPQETKPAATNKKQKKEIAAVVAKEEQPEVANDNVKESKKKGKANKKNQSPAAETNTTTETATVVSKKSKQPKKAVEAAEVAPKTVTKQSKKEKVAKLPIPDESINWGSSNVSMNEILVKSLVSLGYDDPTPIQVKSIPSIALSTHDHVGIAETGSGKTFAYGLPILNTIITQWDIYGSSPVPMALILAPTRELVMQITNVLKTISTPFSQTYCEIHIVAIIGGMSEQKQIRILSSTTKKPIHIIVATPGRLHELMTVEELPIFADMSRYRYLVLDEVDRMLEEGHFPEISNMFARISKHEGIVDRGENVLEVSYREKIGTFEKPSVESENQSPGEGMEGEEGMDEDLMIPNEYDMEIMVDDGAVPPHHSDEDEDDGEDGDFPLEEDDEEPVDGDEDGDNDMDEGEPKEEGEGGELVGGFHFDEPSFEGLPNMPPYISQLRQTLLFSATANNLAGAEKKKRKKIKGIGEGDVKRLPYYLQELLSLVALKKNTMVSDVTKSLEKAPIGGNSANTLPTLPATLKQLEVRVPSEDKDVFAYKFILENPGRILIFVNAIKAARRLDGLLRSLGVNCRVIHAELQQKQRIKALEAFQTSPIGVLVATDVAARGLDIPKVSTVLHYDIARTPQLYIHRSGRTARANQIGATLSIVTPEDINFHEQISLAVMGELKKGRGFEVWNGEGEAMLSLLHQRVKIAKKIFTQSFLINQKQRESKWLNEQTKGTEFTDIDIEDIEIDDSGKKRVLSHEQEIEAKRNLAKLKGELKVLLEKPLNQNYKENEPKRQRAGRKQQNAVKQLQQSKKVRSKFVVVAK